VAKTESATSIVATNWFLPGILELKINFEKIDKNANGQSKILMYVPWNL